MSEETVKNYVFVQKFNALKGCVEWSPAAEDYDYNQEVARSAYADMLHDDHRNVLYRKAIEKSVKKLIADRPDSETIRVVDIGTGTGLLSMLASRAFGEHRNRCKVTAFECFLPMADCAEKVIERNGFGDLIEVIKKRSTQNNELPESEKGDLLLTEVFDTELIGEGMFGTYRFALQNQTKRGVLSVPSKARIWIQLISSKWLQSGHSFRGPRLKNGTCINIPESVKECFGSNQLHDLQLNQIRLNKDIKLISSPQVLFEFNFSDINTLPLEDEKEVKFEIKENVDGDVAIAMWWDLFMDYEDEYLLSCAPFWANPCGTDPGLQPWRDHWIQAVYYLPANRKALKLKTGDTVNIKGYHDEYSLWFDLAGNESSTFGPNCSCGLHSHIVRSRLRMMNDCKRLDDYYGAIAECSPKSVLFLGDASFVPLMIAKTFKDVTVHCVTKDKYSRSFFDEFMRCNDLKLNIVSDEQMLQNEKFDLIVAEPYFYTVNLPWDTLQFLYMLSRIPKSCYDDNNVIVVPQRAEIEAIAVEFDDLWKIRAEVGNCQGFDLKDFDDLVLKAMDKSDAVIESQPLWEYPCRALQDKPFTVFEWDFSMFEFDFSEKSYEFSTVINVDQKLLKHKKNTISLAIWIKFHLSDNKVMTTGPVSPIKLGETICWDREWRQGVAFLFANVKNTRLTNDGRVTFDLKFNYNCNDGELNLTVL